MVAVAAAAGPPPPPYRHVPSATTDTPAQLAAVSSISCSFSAYDSCSYGELLPYSLVSYGLAGAGLGEPGLGLEELDGTGDMGLALGLGLGLELCAELVGELTLGPGGRREDGGEGEGGAQWRAKASSGTCCHRCTVRWRGEENSAAAALQTIRTLQATSL